MKRVLVACEFSQVVTSNFRNLGFEAFSCDILPSEDNSPYHYQCDAMEIDYSQFDIVIAHPPCTYLANSGVSHIYRDVSRLKKLKEARKFFMFFYNLKNKYICIENPVPHKYAELPPYTQIIQPYQFGDPASKKTCLWLKNLPPLKPTNIVIPERIKSKTGKEYDKWWYETGKLPLEIRGKIRSKTFPGIAKAMADQWGSFLLKIY